MTEPVRTPRPVDARTLWAGGGAAALGAALVGLVGIVVCRGLLDVPVLAPQSDGVWGDVDTVAYVGGAALAALVATGLAHLLLLSSPRPGRFFAWIMAVATVAAVLVPFAGTASLASRVATAVINLAVGLAIGTLVGAAGRRAVRKASLTP
jgi:hypothetical protein